MKFQFRSDNHKINEIVIDTLIENGFKAGDMDIGRDVILRTVNNGGYVHIHQDTGVIYFGAIEPKREVYSIEEALKIKASTRRVKLNDSYQATVSKTEIKVGCQTFPVSVLKELMKAVEELE